MNAKRFPRFGSVLRRAARRAPAMLLAASAAVLVAGCAAFGPTDNPVARKLTWFSYLNGDDLRVSCGRGGSDRFRLVFNADYNRHVRTYDITGDLEQGGASVEARVIEATDLARLTPQDPLSAARGAVSEIKLTPQQFAVFIAGLRRSGAFEPAPEGLRLPSNGIYWLVNGCRGGQWFFTAYPYPSGRFTDARLSDLVGGTDRTGIPFPPLPAPADAPRRLPDRADDGVFFELQVADSGLVGPTGTFGPWQLGELLKR